MTSLTKAHISNSIATVLFGLNYWIAKQLMPDYLMPMQIIFLRSLGALSVFFIIGLFIKTEKKIARKDLFKIALCSLFGIAINQICFFKGLYLSTPVETAIIHASCPILVVVFAAFLIRERVSPLKTLGVLVGTSGALLLSVYGKEVSFHSTHFVGNLLIITNITAYALYLVLVKPLMKEYPPLQVMKWLFFFGFLMVLPFTFDSVPDIEWSGLTPMAWASILYVVLATTALTYILTIYALKHLTATSVGYYIYLQPVIAASIGLILGSEMITWVKVVAALLIFAGVYLVNFRLNKI